MFQGWKVILKQLSGKFYGSQLTVVLGQSGCGKSTLLNLLSGFNTKNMSGKIEMNGMNIHEFRKNITYIMQENYLQSLLTVSESLNFAFRLKTENNTTACKWIKMSVILKDFGLIDVENELVGNLSGGQQKRIAIAMEFVDDPQIIFLDEPTTGLDSVSSTTCFNILKNLARRGKTIVCTVHQPTGNQLQMFDQIYAMSSGECIYRGSGTKLVTFLEECSISCPSNYNPADFLLEVVTDVYGDQGIALVEKIQNGKNDNYCASITSNCIDDCLELSNVTHTPPSNVSQFFCLMLRNLKVSFRDKNFMLLRFFMHISVGLLVGSLYYDIGNNAEHILDNFRLLFVAMSFLTYTSYYSIMVVFPIGFPGIKRETFNRWYTPAKWFLAVIICDAPIVILTNIVFLIPVYYLTSQPFESFRFITLLLILLLTSFTSQAFGLLAGSFVGLKVGNRFFFC